MKSIKSLKYMITSCRNPHSVQEKSKSVNQIKEKCCTQAIPSEEKHRVKNFGFQTIQTQNNECIKLDKDQEISLFPKYAEDEQMSKNEAQSKYSQSLKALKTCIREMALDTEHLRENQRKIMKLLLIKFQNIESTLKFMAAKSKSSRKKIEEVFNPAAVETLALTNEIFSNLYNKKTPDIFQHIDDLEHFFQDELQNLLKNQRDETMNRPNFKIPQTQLRKRHKKKPFKNLSASILNLDTSLKKKFLISVQEKIKMLPAEILQESPENIGNASEESPQIKIINSNSEGRLEKALSRKKIYSREMKEEELEKPSVNMNDLNDAANGNEAKAGTEPRHLFTPEQEKNIIMQIMRNESKQAKASELLIHQADEGKENQVKFLINSRWWHKWTMYVNSEIKIYPGKIENRDLISEEFFSNDTPPHPKRLILKENILEHHDYEAVSKNVFRYLKKWYGIDHEIVRFLKRDPLDESKLYLDLYPEKKKTLRSNLLMKNQRNRNHSNEETKVFLTNQSATLNTMNDYPPFDLKASWINNSNSSARVKSFTQNYDPKAKNQENCKIY